MERREFITLLGGVAATCGAAAAWPSAGRAQQPARRPTIGYISPNTASAQRQWTEAFVQRLRELGWIEGSTVNIKYRWADGNTERLREFASELAQDKVDVILTAATPAAIAAKNATAAIPIIFAASGDPIGAGLVASLRRPGGNITGLSLEMTETASKRIELLHEVVPKLRRLAVLTNKSNPAVALEIGEVETAARKLNVETIVLDVRRADDIGAAFASFNGLADALYVSADPLLHSNDNLIIALAVKVRLPSIHNFREEVFAGGLLSYGPNFPDLYRRAAELVDKILRGAKPADIPIEQPTKFELLVNLKTARALELAIPPGVLARADEVIE